VQVGGLVLDREGQQLGDVHGVAWGRLTAISSRPRPMTMGARAAPLRMIMTTVPANLQQVQERIGAACAAAGRPVDEVTLLAVSKTFPAEAVREAFAAGARAFGENYVQEALDKIAALADLRAQIEWHLIGPLQSNKTRSVAEAFDWVQSVDRLKIAQRLAEQRPAGLAPLQLCLQVNISGEASKSGVLPADLPALAAAVAALPADELAAQRAPHRALRALMAAVNAQCGLALDTLSMGMSADLEAAVAEGATVLRVGTAIFGSRPAVAATEPAPCKWGAAG